MNKRVKLYLFCMLALNGALYAQSSDIRGPIRSDQFKVKHNSDGIQATDIDYKPSVNKLANAPWIWIDSIAYPDQQLTKANWVGQRKNDALHVVKFKKIVKISEDVVSAVLKISADIFYKLYINGKLIERGPANIGSDYTDRIKPRHWFYDEFSTKHSLTKGVNVIAVEVFTYTRVASSTTTGHGGFFLDSRVRLKSGKAISIKTDSSWYCQPSKAYLPDFQVNASAESFDWILEKKMNDHWSKAVLLPHNITSKWTLRQSELPQMMEARIYPTKIKRIDSIDSINLTLPFKVAGTEHSQKFRLEFDNLYTGYVGLDVTGAAGTKIKFNIREISGKNGRDLIYILSEGRQTFEFPGLSDGKYIDMEIQDASGDLIVHDVVFNYSSFPVAYTGNFECSDRTLNAIWKNIRWVTQINMQTYHMDSPLHQEPISDAGDYLIESMVNYYTFSSPLLIRQDLRKIALVLDKADYKMFHTSYMLLWEQMLLNYYRYTGDKDLLTELSPFVYKLLHQFQLYKGAKGVITEAPNYMFMDWGEIGKIALHHPPASWGQGYMTAFYYKALKDAMEMAGYLHDKPKYNALNEEVMQLKADFNTAFLDPLTGLYLNGLFGESSVHSNTWMPRDTLLKRSLPYVNTLAIAYGLVPAERQQFIVDHILSQKDIEMSPYFMYFVFEALDVSGNFGKAGIKEMRRWEKLSNNPVGLKEGWDRGDYSHAWGGGPAFYMPASLLGIRPSKPGFSSIRIMPVPGDIKWAKGTISTVKGKVAVQWTNSTAQFELVANTPEGIPAEYIFTFNKKDGLNIDGKKIPGDKIPFFSKNLKITNIGVDSVIVKTLGGNKHIRITRRN